MVDLSYIRDLMKKNYEAVGFIPTPKLERYAERGQILTQFQNGEPCGYLAFGNGWPVLKVYQCCVHNRWTLLITGGAQLSFLEAA